MPEITCQDTNTVSSFLIFFAFDHPDVGLRYRIHNIGLEGLIQWAKHFGIYVSHKDLPLEEQGSGNEPLTVVDVTCVNGTTPQHRPAGLYVSKEGTVVKATCHHASCQRANISFDDYIKKYGEDSFRNFLPAIGKKTATTDVPILQEVNTQLSNYSGSWVKDTLTKLQEEIKVHPSVQWIIPGLYARQESSVTAAVEGVGKSTFIADEIRCIKEGKKVMGIYEPSGKIKVMYIYSDQTSDHGRTRILAPAGLEMMETGDNLDFHFIPTMLLPGFDKVPMNLCNEDHFGKFCALMEEFTPDLVYCDSSSTLLMPEKYDAFFATRVMYHIAQATKKFNNHIQMIAHIRKRKDSHERKEKLTSEDVMGSGGGYTRQASWALGLEPLLVKKKITTKNKEGKEISKTIFEQLSQNGFPCTRLSLIKKGPLKSFQTLKISVEFDDMTDISNSRWHLNYEPMTREIDPEEHYEEDILGEDNCCVSIMGFLKDSAVKKSGELRDMLNVPEKTTVRVYHDSMHMLVAEGYVEKIGNARSLSYKKLKEYKTRLTCSIPNGTDLSTAE